MNDDTLKTAVAAAKEFITRAKVYKDSETTYTNGDYTYHCRSVTASGALRRQSMELTRALAAWRKP
jgi:uncharacterized protein with PhoU and TrkA domain